MADTVTDIMFCRLLSLPLELCFSDMDWCSLQVGLNRIWIERRVTEKQLLYLIIMDISSERQLLDIKEQLASNQP